MSYPIPNNEDDRLSALRRYSILDTPIEPAYDHIVSLVEQIFNVPVAAISLVDSERQWFKACCGLDTRETSRDIAFCAYAILSDETMVVEDALEDPRFHDNPLVVGPPHVRSYIGAPLINSEGFRLGTICAIDTKPRHYTADQMKILSTFATLVVREMEHRVNSFRHEAETNALELMTSRINMLLSASTSILIGMDQYENIIWWNSRADEILGLSSIEATGKHIGECGLQWDQVDIKSCFSECHRTGQNVRRDDIAYDNLVGENRILGINLHPVLDLNRNLEGYLLVAADITERRKSETALRDNEARLSGMINSAMDGIIIVDDLQRITLFNPAAEKMFGYNVSEMLGNSLDRLIPHRYLSVHADHIRTFGKFNCTQRNMGGAGIVHGLRANGEEFPIEASISQTDVEDKKQYTVILRDITERLRTEEIFSQLAAIVTSSDDAIISKTLDGIITSWNPGAERLFGYTEEEAIGKSMLILCPPERESEEQSILMRFRQGESVQHFDTVRVHKDGRPIDISVTISPVRNSRGEVIGASKVARDISQHKKFESALRKSDERFQQIADTISQVFWIFEYETRTVSYISRAYETIWQRNRNSLYQNRDSWIESIHPDDRERIVHTFDGLTNGDFKMEYRIVRPDGEIRWIQVCAYAVLDDRGEKCRCIGVAEDITERRKVEDDIKMYTQMLEEATIEAERKSLLLEEQTYDLAEARDAAMVAARMKSEFLANMSHEIRTPLNGVVGLTEVLSYTSLDQSQQSYLRTIQSCVSGLLHIINDILDFSKIKSGKLQLEKIDFSLLDVLEDTVALLSPKAHEKGIEVCCTLPHLSPQTNSASNRLQGDPHRLKQVITNLFGNAIKFTDRGGEIEIGTELLSESSTEANWKIFVRDSGIGIPIERQEAVFESFTQADGSTTRSYGGTGLGLTISRQIVRLMGGRIGLQSQDGEGSEFWVEITFPKQSVFEPENHSSPKPFDGLQILIVDDHTSSNTATCMLLNSWGCSVTQKYSGKEVLESLEMSSNLWKIPDLVLLDMLMPQMDGRELAKRIHEIPSMSKVPLTLLCSIGAPGVAEAMNDTLFHSCLCKPIRQIELWNLLMNIKSAPEQVSLFNASSDLNTDQSKEKPISRLKSSKRILLVEDNSVNQMVALKLLDQCGISSESILTVNNGREALAAVEKETFDLIFMDVQMPILNGFEATEAIRTREQECGTPPLPIIAMTAHASNEDREKCLSIGMSDYLCKPFSSANLAVILDRWLPSSMEPDLSVKETNSFIQNPRASTAYLDEDRLAAISAGDREIELKILLEYLETTTKAVIRCELCVETEDGVGLEYWAHMLKGSSSTVGATSLAEISYELELLGKQDRAGQGEGPLARLKEVWIGLKDYLQLRLEKETKLNKEKSAA